MSDASPSTLDFSAYRRPELFEKISALISVPRTVSTIAKCGVVALLAIWLVLLLGFGDRLHWGWYVALYAYGTIAGVGLGTLTGMALSLNRGLVNLVHILDMSLEISQQATRDMAAVREGKTKPPTVHQVVSGVYEQVILSTLEGVVMGQSRWLGRIVFPVYRWTLGRVVTYALKRFEREEEEPSDAVAVVEATTSEESTEVDASTESTSATQSTGTMLARAEASTAHAVRWLTHARTYVNGLGDGFRRTIMISVTIALVTFALLCAAPIAVVWWLR